MAVAWFISVKKDSGGFSTGSYVWLIINIWWCSNIRKKKYSKHFRSCMIPCSLIEYDLIRWKILNRFLCFINNKYMMVFQYQKKNTLNTFNHVWFLTHWSNHKLSILFNRFLLVSSIISLSNTKEQLWLDSFVKENTVLDSKQVFYVWLFSNM